MGAAGAGLAGLCEPPCVGVWAWRGADSAKAATAGPGGCPATPGGPFRSLKRFVFEAALPLLPIGKIDKTALKRRAAAGAEALA